LGVASGARKALLMKCLSEKPEKLCSVRIPKNNRGFS
jgi:hypothetical protein